MTAGVGVDAALAIDIGRKGMPVCSTNSRITLSACAYAAPARARAAVAALGRNVSAQSIASVPAVVREPGPPAAKWRRKRPMPQRPGPASPGISRYTAGPRKSRCE